MTDTEQILIKMGEGFGKIHDRLNILAGESAARQLGCQKRFGDIEKEIGIKSAVNGVEEKVRARKIDFQSYLVRTALVTIIGGVLVIIWKIFVGHIDLIVK